jgi:quercetin dioxygenase-like cupin family protein
MHTTTDGGYMHMLLEPGETFEHSHQGSSITTLIEGEVDLITEGVRVSLVAGAATPLAPNVSHVLVNVGDGVATVKCIHTLGEVPAP